MTLEFSTRAKRMDTETAKRWRWTSTCGHYWAVKVVSKFSLPTVFHAIHLDAETGQTMINNRCRTKDGAIAKCQEHANERAKPKRRRAEK
jgi:hypothetical protein